MVTNSISLPVNIYSDFLFFIESVLVVCVFSRNLSISSVLSNLLAYNHSEHFLNLNAFYFSKVSSGVCFFIPNFSNLRHVLLSLSSQLKAQQFVDFLKNQLLVLVIFLNCFSIVDFIIFALVIIFFFLPLWGFICYYFSSFLGY